ncbi:hypothetical protein ES708_32743 [subsurface metagenome]
MDTIGREGLGIVLLRRGPDLGIAVYCPACGDEDKFFDSIVDRTL